MKLRLFISIFMGYFVISASAFAADIPVTVYADSKYPPYSYLEGGEAKGIYTEIVKVAFSRMKGYMVTIEAIPWKRGLKRLENGEGFALYPPYFHVLKRPYIWPYSLPILDERVVVFCREGVLAKSLRPNWPEDYYNLTIGNNAGFHLGGEEFWQAVKQKKINIEEVGGSRANLLKLGLRRTDCYMNDRLSILWELKKLKAKREYDEGGRHARLVEGATISIEQGFLGFTNTDKGKFPFKEDFKKKFDIIIYDMRRNGELQRIVNDFVK